MQYIISLLIGISLSATSGFRLFVPMLVISYASLTGRLELSPAFEWIGTYPALAAFAIAALLELTAYFIPYVDNLLSTAAVPVSILAGTIITASVMVGLPPMLTWTLAIVAGGGAALGGSSLSNLLHSGSTVTTGGTANPLLSLAETVISVILSVLAVLVPLLAFLLLALLVFVVTRFFRNQRRRKAQQGPSAQN